MKGKTKTQEAKKKQNIGIQGTSEKEIVKRGRVACENMAERNNPRYQDKNTDQPYQRRRHHHPSSLSAQARLIILICRAGAEVVLTLTRCGQQRAARQYARKVICCGVGCQYASARDLLVRKVSSVYIVDVISARRAAAGTSVV